MPYVLKASPAANAVAIYSVNSLNSVDTAPLTDPNANTSRLKFHSSFFYPYIVDTGPGITRSGTVTFPNVSASSVINTQTSITLFAHGRGGTPMLSGYLVNRYGQIIDLVGTTYIWDPDGGANNWSAYPQVNWERMGWWVDLSADSSNVYLVFNYNRIPTDFSRQQSVLTYTYFVRVFNDLVTGPAEQGDGSALVYGAPGGSYIKLGRGRVDSRRRYLYRDDTNGQPLPTSRTIRLNTIASSNSLQVSHLRAEMDAGNYYRQFNYPLSSGKTPLTRTLTATYIGVTV
jgi:hypothetical protein